MQDQLPILIFAQSGRFIAQSATRSGFRTWVADCFCDSDTRAVASRWQRLPPIAELTTDELLEQLRQLSGGEACYLVCGTGIERLFPVLERLPAHIRLLGPSATLINRLKQAAYFFPLLDELGLRHPEISHDRPAGPPDGWLLKPSCAYGGTAIRPATASPSAGDYFQRFIDGDCASVCFIADGTQARLLAVNRQLNRPASFGLQHIIAPLAVTQQQSAFLADAVNKITHATGLRGICSLDFIIDAHGDVFILELNPRLSASAELLPEQQSLFSWHLQACRGRLPATAQVHAGAGYHMLSYLYADADSTIPAAMDWPDCCHDRSPAGTVIERGQPICTMLSQADSEQACLQQFAASASLIRRKIGAVA